MALPRKRHRARLSQVKPYVRSLTPWRIYAISPSRFASCILARISSELLTLCLLPQSVGCSGSITMPSLDDGSYSGANTTATVAGWGVTSERGRTPDVMHSVDLMLLTNAQCGTYGYAGELVESMICAIGDLEGGEDSCQGDSGGPLFVQQAPSAPPSVALRGSSPPHPSSHFPHSSRRPPSRPHRGGMTSSSA